MDRRSARFRVARLDDSFVLSGREDRVIMLDSIKTFFAELAGGAKHPERFDDNDSRLAAAALLVHALNIDGEISPIERARLHAVLKYRFNLDNAATDELIDDATVVEGEAVDLYHFTSVIMRSVNEEGRLRIIEMMWELVYADGQVSEFEDNVVWRAADLLGISSRDRIELKHRIAGRQPASAPGE